MKKKTIRKLLSVVRTLNTAKMDLRAVLAGEALDGQVRLSLSMSGLSINKAAGEVSATIISEKTREGERLVQDEGV